MKVTSPCLNAYIYDYVAALCCCCCHCSGVSVFCVNAWIDFISSASAALTILPIKTQTHPQTIQCRFSELNHIKHQICMHVLRNWGRLHHTTRDRIVANNHIAISQRCLHGIKWWLYGCRTCTVYVTVRQLYNHCLTTLALNVNTIQHQTN